MQFLDPARDVERELLHVILGLHELSGGLALDMRPNLLMIQVRRKGQVEQLEYSALCFEEGLDWFEFPSEFRLSRIWGITPRKLGRRSEVDEDTEAGVHGRLK
jgi:hypothetical protein